MRPPENRNAAPAGTGNRVECVAGKADETETTSTTPAALVILATRLRVPVYMARLYAGLAGWRIAA
jgi:hypothetical protein